MNNTVNEINIVKQMLVKFQEGYTKRDTTNIDSFMDELFIKDENTSILGTSNGEMCLGFESAKELIKSDWEYWGDVKLDLDSLIVHRLGSTLWFALQGNVKYTFRTDKGVWGRYVSFVENCLNTAENGLKEGLTIMNWGLSHLLFPRSPEERGYLWPMRLTGAMIQENGAYKFHYMQFSLPCSVYPDIRTGTKALDNLFEESPFDTGRFKQVQNAAEIKTFINEFSKEFVQNDIINMTKYFNNDKSTLLVGPKGPWHIGFDTIAEGLGMLRNKWGAMELDLDNGIVYGDDESAWILCGGNMHKTMEEDEVLREQTEDIRNILSSSMDPKEKLFHIQRNTLASFKEVASGNTYNWPCRFEAALSRKETGWLISCIQLSFPFYYILEDKLDGEKLF